MAHGKRCGNCELLRRSSTPGLATYGKCPHRNAWVRVQDEPCEHHEGEPRGPLVKVFIVANLLAAATGIGIWVWMDLRRGNALTHALLAGAGVILAIFAVYIQRSGLFVEDAKFELLDAEDPPPEEDRTPPEF